MILNRKMLMCCLVIFCLFLNMFSFNAFSAASDETQIVEILRQSLILKIESADAYVNNKKIAIDSENPEVAPVTKDNRTLVPLRFITENFGGEVEWDAATSNIVIKTQGKVIKLRIGSKTMTIDNKKTTLDVPAQLINGRTFIPLRQLVENALGKKIFFSNEIIIISDTEIPPDEASSSKYIEQILSSFEVKSNELFSTTEEIGANKTEQMDLKRHFSPANKKPNPGVWISRNLPSVNFTGITCGNSLYVIVGENGTIYTSEDGAAWSPQNSGTTMNLWDVCWNGSIFVALGDKDGILTSYDGKYWTSSSTKANEQLYSITTNGSMFVAAGVSGGVLTSPDGLEWTHRPSTTTANLNQVVWARDKFWIAGEQNTILSSSDGIEWKKMGVGLPLQIDIWNLVFSDKDIVAFVTPSAPKSSVYKALETYELKKARFAYYDKRGSAGLTSEDGEVWTIRKNSTYSPLTVWDGSRYVSLKGTSKDLLEWSGEENKSNASTVYKMIYNDGLYIAIGASGTILLSQDGNDWFERSIGHEKDIHSVAINADIIVAVGSEYINASNDGISWSRISQQLSGKYVGKLSDGFASLVGMTNRLVEPVNIYGTSDILFSSNGNTWKTQFIGKSSNALNAFTQNRNAIVAVGNKGMIYSSNDGSLWTRRDADAYGSKIVSYEYNDSPANTPRENFYSVACNDDVFVAVGNKGALFISTDGIQWVRQKSNTPKALTDVIWTGSKFVAVGIDSTVCFSSNGYIWSASTIDRQKPNLGINAIEWNGKEYMAVGELGYIYTSTNGSKWTKMESGTDRSLYDILWTGERYVVTGANGTILTLDE